MKTYTQIAAELREAGWPEARFVPGFEREQGLGDAIVLSWNPDGSERAILSKVEVNLLQPGSIIDPLWSPSVTTEHDAIGGDETADYRAAAKWCAVNGGRAS